MTDQDQVYKVTPSEAVQMIPIAGKANVPLIMVGASGGGKTRAIRDWQQTVDRTFKERAADFHKLDTALQTGELHRAMGTVPPNAFHYWGWHLSRTRPEDFGVPVPVHETKRLEFYVPAGLPLGCEDAGVIDWSELDRCQADVQSAVLDLILERELGKWKLSPNAIQVGSMNGESDEGTEELVEALRGRVMFIYISGGSSEADVDSYLRWAEKNGVTEALRDFVEFKPDVIEAFDDFAERSICRKRTLTMADRVYQAAQESTQNTSALLTPMMAGLVGKANAVELLAFYEIHDKIPKPKDVVGAPATAMIPSEPSMLAALSSALTRYVGDDAIKAHQALKYATRLPNESAMALIRRLAEAAPAIITSGEYDKWAKENRAMQ